jgi:hypothetical protein
MKRDMGRIAMAIALGVPALAGCDDTSGPDDDAIVLTWDFAAAAHGWTAGFADYPVGAEDAYELESGHSALPAPLDQSRKGLLLSGNNHSDDLLMYVTRRVDGLEPGTTYRVRFEVEIATSAPRGCVGVGGSAGESVYVKAGAADVEPERTSDDQQHWRLSVDIGNQGADGVNGITIGDVANTGTDCASPVYQLKQLASAPKVLEVQTDDQGSLWLIVGIDSGFEATTRLWFTRIGVRLTEAAG